VTAATAAVAFAANNMVAGLFSGIMGGV